jgi:hypothetical protein
VKRFKVLTSVKVSIVFFWVVTSCSLGLNPKDWGNTKTLVTLNKSTRRHKWPQSTWKIKSVCLRTTSWRWWCWSQAQRIVYIGTRYKWVVVLTLGHFTSETIPPPPSVSLDRLTPEPIWIQWRRQHLNNNYVAVKPKPKTPVQCSNGWRKNVFLNAACELITDREDACG